VTGTVFDVAVDIRRSSPTFSRWVGVVLSEQNHAMLWVPPGFAHGFLVLSESADFLYRCTDFYAPAYERTIRWNDVDLGVKWPLPNGLEPVLSAQGRGCRGLPRRGVLSVKILVTGVGGQVGRALVRRRSTSRGIGRLHARRYGYR